MRILYLANVRLPTEKAHGLQIMKSCEAFAKLGHEVTLVVPRRKNSIPSDPFAYYNVQKNFDIQRVWSLDLVRWGRLGFYVQYASFSMVAALRTDVRTAELVYGRDELALLVIATLRGKFPVWESHDGVWNLVARALVGRLRGMIVVTKGARAFYLSKIPGLRIHAVPNGIDLVQFANPEPRSESRSRLGLPQDKKVIMYIGRLDGWKGTQTLFRAAQLLPDSMLVAIIGGEPEQIESLSSLYAAVRFLGYRPYRELPNNQVAADIVVLPNTGGDTISARFTSPLKLFSYMASGVPIVASDLPSIREILDESTAILVPPDDPAALSNAIVGLVNDVALGKRLADHAREKVRQYTWEERAKRVLDFIGSEG